jgi:hypothetical protein
MLIFNYKPRVLEYFQGNVINIVEKPQTKANIGTWRKKFLSLIIPAMRDMKFMRHSVFE